MAPGAVISPPTPAALREAAGALIAFAAILEDLTPEAQVLVWRGAQMLSGSSTGPACVRHGSSRKQTVEKMRVSHSPPLPVNAAWRASSEWHAWRAARRSPGELARMTTAQRNADNGTYNQLKKIALTHRAALAAAPAHAPAPPATPIINPSPPIINPAEETHTTNPVAQPASRRGLNRFAPPSLPEKPISGNDHSDYHSNFINEPAAAVDTDMLN
jgi:hypothetical protein